MATAQQVLDVARGEIGQTEQPRGSNLTKYGAWYGVNPAPWCAMFCSWVLNMAGAGNLIAGARTDKGAAYSGDILNFFAQQGRVNFAPAPGAMVIWDWPGVGTQNDHIGFVEVDNGNGTVGTIEGNSPGSGFVYDVVGRHVRDAQRFVRGYCHPAYGDVPMPVPQPVPPPQPHPQQEDLMKGRIIQCQASGDQGNAAKNQEGWFFALCNPKPVKWHVPTVRLADFMLVFGHSTNNRPDQVPVDIYDSYTTI